LWQGIFFDLSQISYHISEIFFFLVLSQFCPDSTFEYIKRKLRGSILYFRKNIKHITNTCCWFLHLKNKSWFYLFKFSIYIFFINPVWTHWADFVIWYFFWIWNKLLNPGVPIWKSFWTSRVGCIARFCDLVLCWNFEIKCWRKE